MKIAESKTIVRSFSQRIIKRGEHTSDNEVSYVMRRSVLATLMGYHKRRVEKGTKLTISDRLFG